MADQGRLSVTCAWEVPPGAAGHRVDAFVRRCLPHLSLREARRAIEEGAFWLDDRPARKGNRVFPGSILSLKGFSHLLAESPIPAADLEVPILYEDDSVLALDKPAGIATHGFSGRQSYTVANFLAAARPTLVGVGMNRWEVGLVHRLDRDTSGIVLAAKDQDAFDHLRAQFRRAAVGKYYWALARGKAEDERLIAAPLMREPGDPRKMKPVAEAGKRGQRARKWRAWTRFQRVAYARGYSLLRVEIGTGVTHQIRVHLASIGHPLAGDPLYGEGRDGPVGIGRLFLHACSLTFRHPRDDREITLASPLPPELKNILRRLKIKL
ncbi:MAG: RluA family pseudouridine synthase [Deltaproteobacteria bacterium]|nr:RluA family pseudouridine synthase [Deltaproteobacteria bacterium]